VLDTPLAENGIIGGAIGMALYGLKPVAEIQFVDFIYPGFDQIVSELAKFRWRSAGQYACPVVVRAPYGGGIRGGLYHSQSPEAYFCPHDRAPGGDPVHAVGCQGPAALGDPGPGSRDLPRAQAALPEHQGGRGGGRVHHTDRQGAHGARRRARQRAHLRCDGRGLARSRRAAAARGWNVEVLDLRTLLPLDTEAVLESVRRTGRVVIVHEAPRTCGYGAELAAIVAEQALTSLQAPVSRVTGYDTPFPYTLEHTYLPDAKRVLAALEHVMSF
jgi:2-oxoisovalerate dehydrogenase E1 component beta subunit